MIDGLTDLDLVITDLKMPGADGLALLRALKQQGRDVPLVMITAYGSIEKAVEAMKSGAADFITKPFNKDVIRHVVHKLLKSEDLKRENELLRQSCPAPGVIARSPAMRAVSGPGGQGGRRAVRRPHPRRKRRGQGSGGAGHPCPKRPGRGRAISASRSSASTVRPCPTR